VQRRFAAGAIERAAENLSINGDNAPALLGKRCHEPLKRGPEPIRVE
jgi:hypothetical protein